MKNFKVAGEFTGEVELSHTLEELVDDPDWSALTPFE